MAAAMIAVAAAPLQAQDAFGTRSNRQGTAVSLTMSGGDWLVAPGYSEEMYRVELDRGPLGMRVGFGDVISAGESYSALTGGADFALGLPSIPVNLTIGAQFSQAEVAGDMKIRQFGAPVHLSNAAVLMFDHFWVHPIVAFGGFAHRTEMVETETGFKKFAAAGIELGHGPMSLRGSLQHHVKSPQQGNVSIRYRF
jgi:hypothetical protein